MTAKELLSSLNDMAYGFVPEQFLDTEKVKIHMTQYVEEAELLRKNAAVLIHFFIREGLKVSDLVNMDELSDMAKNTRDLFDCRICANSIMQVLLRKLMLPQRINFSDSSFYLFRGNDLFTEADMQSVKKYIKKLLEELN